MSTRWKALLYFISSSGFQALVAEPVVITDQLYHLGSSKKPEWKDFTTEEPAHRNQLEVELNVRKEAREYTIEIQAGDVDADWRVSLNDEPLGSLRRVPDLTVQYLRVPSKALRDGKNQLRVVGLTFRRGDDIYVGKAILHDRPLSEVAGYARVSVRVREAGRGGEGSSCRLTVVKTVQKKDSRGKETLTDEYADFVPLKEQEKDLAVRKGIAYARNGLAEFDIPAGKYTLYATRGFEYGLGVANLDLKRLDKKQVDIELVREVDTTHLLAADTHVHTKTYSFHGDINMEERVIAIAGEGVELAIATDHNHHTDYRPTIAAAGLEKAFVPIMGNEVTTSWGHFNAFPVKKDEPPADYDHSDWVNLVKAMRKSSGVRVVIVNHPRRDASEAATFAAPAPVPAGGGQASAAGRNAAGAQGSGTGQSNAGAQSPAGGEAADDNQAADGSSGEIGAAPTEEQSTFGRIGFNPVSGEAHRGPKDLGIDAVEVINGKTLEDDNMLTLNDWFGMLNRGYRIAAVAGSDSHSLNEIVGQARTYVPSSTDDPHKISIDEICNAFLEGRLLVSLGLLTEAQVNGKFVPGDLCTGLGDEIEVHIKVQGPSWTRATSVALFLNGLEARREKIEPSERALKFEAVWRIPRPAHDVHLVVVATGPPVTALYWPISGGEKRYLLGATNAIWVDADGDGKFTSAFGYASGIVDAHGLLGDAPRAALRDHDRAVVAQYASLVRAKAQADLQIAYERILAETDAGLSGLIEGSDPGLKVGIERYLTTSPKVDVSTRYEKEAKAARLEKEEAVRAKKKEDEKKRRAQQQGRR